MKILHICPQYTEGLSYQENYLPKYQKKIGNEVSLVACNWEYNDAGVFEKSKAGVCINKDGIKIIRLRIEKDKSYFKKFKMLEGLDKVIENETPDLIFLHGCQHCYIKTVVDYVKKNSQTKVIVDNHADYSNSATSWVSKNILHRIIWRYYAKMIEPYTAVFYGVLPSRVKFLSELYGIPPQNCEYLSMGADDELVDKADLEKEEVKNELSIRENDLHLITGGKIDKSKMQTLLLMKAVNEINKQKLIPYNLKLTVFGLVTPEIKEEFEQLCNENICYLGWMKSEKTYRYIAAADLAVYPGRHSVLWEQTAAQGIPMIVKFWDGTDHVNVEENVKFIHQDSVEEIKAALVDILGEKQNLEDLKSRAQKGKTAFLYSEIAKKSLSKIEK